MAVIARVIMTSVKVKPRGFLETRRIGIAGRFAACVPSPGAPRNAVRGVTARRRVSNFGHAGAASDNFRPSDGPRWVKVGRCTTRGHDRATLGAHSPSLTQRTSDMKLVATTAQYVPSPSLS